jgi:glutamate carboxypeptidase
MGRMKDFSDQLEWIETQQEPMEHLLIRWANVNSGSRNIAGLERTLALVKEAFGALGGEMKTVELSPQSIVDARGDLRAVPLGRALSIVKRPEARLRVFLGIHYDTVYPADHPFQECAEPDRGALGGPGVADAKGGLVVMLKALEALERSPWAEKLGWEVLINPDEEVGSPGSSPLLAQAASRNHLGLAFEPALPDGSLVGSRKGSGNFVAVVRGKAAHAGRDTADGRNAINAMARFITDLNSFTSSEDRVTINVGHVEGGGPLNVVPDLAIVRFNMRVSSHDDQRAVEQHVNGVSADVNRMDGISVHIHGGFTRVPKPLQGRTLKLFQKLNECGRDLGISISWKPSGGASDGNILAAAGLPTVDSLGVRGGEIHSSNEYIELDSLTERTGLVALLLMKLASGEIDWFPEATPS